MAATSIEWCDHSINPIRASNADGSATGHYCEKISSGCAHCYASELQKRFQMPAFGGAKFHPDGEPLLAGQHKFNGDVRPWLDESKLAEVLKRRKPTRYFVGDMTDVFGWWVPDAWLNKLFVTFALAPQHTFMLLTKRPERMRDFVRDGFQPWTVLRGFVGPTISTHDDVEAWCNRVGIRRSERERRLGIINDGGGFKYPREEFWPLPNVWLGVSAEHQSALETRVPDLLATPAAVRFVSAEPLLGPLEFLPGWFSVDTEICPAFGDISCNCGTLDWLIVGGESGHGARPCNVEWIRSIRDQCCEAGSACFVKQLGADAYSDTQCTCGRNADGHWKGPAACYSCAGRLRLRDKKGGDPAEWPDDLRVREFPTTAKAGA